MTNPSPLPYPSPAASNVRQRPVGESACQTLFLLCCASIQFQCILARHETVVASEWRYLGLVRHKAHYVSGLTWSWHMPAVVAYISIMLLPPARPASRSPYERARCAKWEATKEDEQAVSVLIHGPFRLKVYESRPTIYGGPLPTKAWDGSLDPACTCTSMYSWYMQPM